MTVSKVIIICICNSPKLVCFTGIDKTLAILRIEISIPSRFDTIIKKIKWTTRVSTVNTPTITRIANAVRL